jgi:Flp pilus assembly protein CpaB
VHSLQVAQRFVTTKVLATRQGTVLLGLGAAVVAGLLLLVYLNQYRDSVSSGTAPVGVLVAKRVIEQGTSGAEIASSRLFEIREVSTEHVKPGALTDASGLRFSVVVQDIFPGQQLTAADFTPLGAALGTQLVKNQRAISLPIDSTHGLIGQIQAGDRVDAYGGFSTNIAGSDQPVLKLLMQDVLVLSVTGVGAGGVGQQQGSGSTVVLRVNARQAAELAFTNDNGKLWLVLRPRTGAPVAKPRLITKEKLLFGARPLSVGP